MAADTAVTWGQYLTNPFALTGFALFLMAGLATVIQKLSSKTITNAARERLFKLVILSDLTLGGLAIAFGFLQPLLQPKPIIPPAPPVVLEQEMSGIKNSTAVQAGCEGIASKEGSAKVEKTGKPDTAVLRNQRMHEVEGSVALQAGCNAAAQGQASP